VSGSPTTPSIASARPPRKRTDLPPTHAVEQLFVDCSGRLGVGNQPIEQKAGEMKNSQKGIQPAQEDVMWSNHRLQCKACGLLQLESREVPAGVHRHC